MQPAIGQSRTKGTQLPMSPPQEAEGPECHDPKGSCRGSCGLSFSLRQETRFAGRYFQGPPAGQFCLKYVSRAAALAGGKRKSRNSSTTS